MKIESTKKKKRKEEEKTLCALTLSKWYLKTTIWIILINPLKNIFLNFENKLLNRKIKNEKEETAGLIAFSSICI